MPDVLLMRFLCVSDSLGDSLGDKRDDDMTVLVRTGFCFMLDEFDI